MTDIITSSLVDIVFHNFHNFDAVLDYMWKHLLQWSATGGPRAKTGNSYSQSEYDRCDSEWSEERIF